MTSTAGFDAERPGLEELLVHRAFLVRLARSLLRDGAAAEDVVQATYVRALESGIPRFERGASRGWLARITRRQALNALRAIRRSRGHERALAAQRPEAGVPSAADIAHREAVRRLVVDAVGDLPEPYRSTVLLRYFEDLDPRDIAARFEVDASTARSRLQRAREMLRERLDRGACGDRRRWATALVPFCGPALHATQSSFPFAWSWFMVRSSAATTTTLKWGVVLVATALLMSLAWIASMAVRAEPGRPTGSEMAAVGSATDRVAAPERSPTPPRSAVPTGAAAPPSSTATAAPESVRRALTGFRGRVVDEDGRAVSGVRVVVLRAAADSWWAPETDVDGGVAGFAPSLRAGTVEETGADGRFAVSGVPPGGTCVVRLDRAGAASHAARSVWVDRMPRPGEVQDLGDLVFAAGARITGRIVDPAGRPVADAIVVATDLPAPYVPIAATWLVAEPDAGLVGTAGAVDVWPVPAWVGRVSDQLAAPRVRTGSDGRFELEGLGPGRWSVIGHAVGLGTVTRRGVELPSDGVIRLGDVPLPAGVDVEGAVVDGDGRPVTAADVLIAADPIGAPFALAVGRERTGVDGRFLAERVALEEGLPLRIAARRAGAWTVGESARAGAPVQIELPPSRRLEVVVTGVDITRDGSIRCEVHADRGPALARRLEFGAVERISLEPVPAAVGRDRELRFATELDAARYALRVWRGATLVHEQSIVLEFDRECVVAIAPADELLLQVRDGSGGVVDGARVVVEDAERGRWTVGATDAAGRLTIPTRSPGLRQLDVWHPRHGTASRMFEPARSNGVVTLTMRGHGSLVGNVAGAPPDRIESCTVVARAEGGSVPRLATVDPEDGGFAMHALDPGRYVVSIARLDAASLAGAIELATGAARGPTTAETVVVIEPGRTTSTTIDLSEAVSASAGATAALRGTVVLDGQPAVGMRVYATPAEDDGVPQVESTDAAGRFDLGQLPAPGRYFVVAYDVDQRCFADNQPHTQWSGWVDLVAGVDREVSIAVDTASVAGTVLDANGDPIAGALVVVRGALVAEPRAAGRPTTSRYVVEVGSDGRFQLDGVPPGEWCVGLLVRGRQGVQAESCNHELAAGQRLRGLVLRIP